MSGVEPGRCPVCQAGFRGSAVCPRCGADLAPLMLLAAQAYALRENARRALREADAHSALESAHAAQNLHATAQGRLLLLCATALLHDGAGGQTGRSPES